MEVLLVCFRCSLTKLLFLDIFGFHLLKKKKILSLIACQDILFVYLIFCGKIEVN